MTKHAAERYALVAAGAFIVALTAGGFWLSYAHLAEVAGQHGLGSSPVRQWAWPATLDAFIVAGELLMLRAGLRRVPDWWAIGLTATGSVGSIALNVAGVNGTDKATEIPLLDYVVAAVPPTAALLAFGVLMRQIHQLVAEPLTAPAGADTASGAEEDPSAAQANRGSASAQVDQGAGSSEPDEGLADRGPHSPENGAKEADSNPSDTEATEGTGDRRKGRPPGATMDQLLAVARPAVAEQGISRAVVKRAVKDAKLPLGSTRFTELMRRLRAERTQPQAREHAVID
ncbi:DUF2637 domain-containing protein [Streptomyces sp. ISL-96]|uniref:DUF2637 domain-containing protein n=1 Tax=Streptomyces sp. ISL-96 TaxID=2819191 RepID=UPI001BE6466B|nr:DUF2637 domain-containing protein [Streptomyces sp. ISL-96]MBT2492134.1 DUF2637 domain-containing protein [Streptomyces sp. ISL-96]